MNSHPNPIADFTVAALLRELDLVLALHDAKLIDKQVVADRWRATADREDLALTEGVRNYLRKSAEGLDAADGTVK